MGLFPLQLYGFYHSKIKMKQKLKGYAQKRKLFRNNSFVFVYSSVKKIYSEQLSLQCNGITWLNVTSFSPCYPNWQV